MTKLFSSKKMFVFYKGNDWDPKNAKQGLFWEKYSIKHLIQLVCITLCSACFVYQISQLISIYWSGKTVVENRIYRFRHSQLPAMTICLPTFMDMDKFAQFWLKNTNQPKDAEMFEKFARYKDDILNERYNDTIDNQSRELSEYIIQESYGQNMDKFTLADIFDKISADIEVEYKFPSLAFNETGHRNNVPLPIRVHSLVPFEEQHICITLFGDFDDNFRHKKLGLIQMEMRFKHNNLSFPYTKYYEEDFYIALHSPNILPPYRRENTFQKLTMGNINYITYHEAQTVLLPPPYETNCRTYSVNNSRQQDLRSDCIQKCVFKHINKKYGNNCVPTHSNDKLVRRENLFDMANAHFCDSRNDARSNEMGDYIFDVQKTCENECPRNCMESFYNYEIAVRKNEWFKEPRPNWFSINMEHSRYPDQVIEHKPIMSWITLVSDFGGLLGMWLGLSVIFVCDRLLNKIFK